MNNRITLLPDGPAAFQALIALIEGARHSLSLLFYIYDADTSGRRIRDALAAAAARGVVVRLGIDGFGSAATPDAFFDPLRTTGGTCCRFLPKWGRRYVLRNHQKLAIADGTHAIIGGFNIADAYFMRDHQAAWHDLGAVVEGPCVAHAQSYFNQLFMWMTAPKQSILALRRLLTGLTETSGSPRWIFSGPGPGNAFADSVRRDLVRVRRISMIMAYFVPPPRMLRRLARAARKAETRIITAGKSDAAITRYAARHSYGLLRRGGAKIMEYQACNLHAKLIVMDDIVYLGSANFDMRSLRINCELMLRVEDRTLADACRALCDTAAGDSLVYDNVVWRHQASWFKRLVWGASYWFLATIELLFVRRLVG